MGIELDHLFVCTAPGAPEAEKLVQVGLREGVPNNHPGQGTANRRFDFVNAMIELIWVSDAKEAQSPRARRTLLWERWSVGLLTRLLSAFACALPILKTHNPPSLHGSIDRPIYHIPFACMSPIPEWKSRCGSI
jgi:hypothetical protein